MKTEITIYNENQVIDEWSCPLCGNTDMDSLRLDDDCEIVHCDVCGNVYRID